MTLPKVIILGNPGLGKSTFLNALIHRNGGVEKQFSCGVGSASTTSIGRHVQNGIEYINVPGINDSSLKAEIVPEIQKEISHGGKVKLLFIIKQEAFRVPSHEIDNFKLIFNSIKYDSNFSFGVIVNKIDYEEFDELTNENNPDYKSHRLEKFYTDINFDPNYSTQFIKFEIKGKRWKPSKESLDFIEDQVPWIELDPPVEKDFLERFLDEALKSCPNMAKEYLKKAEGNSENAINSTINWAMISTASSGFASNVVGFIESMILLAPEMAYTAFKNIQMIGIIAIIRGYAIDHPNVRIMIKATLIGSTVSDIAKDAGVKFGVNAGKAFLQQNLTRNIITAINKRAGFRFLTKNGKTGVINAMKVLPIFGGLIGLGLNTFETKSIGALAKQAFVLLELPELPKKQNLSNTGNGDSGNGSDGSWATIESV